MSVRTELEEVLEWVADLMTSKPQPSKEPLSSEDWGLVQGRLKLATNKLGEAQSALLKRKACDKNLPSVLTELAADITRQSQALVLRAEMLKQRAEPDSPERAAAKVAEQAEAERAKAERERQRAAKEAAAGEAKAGGKEAHDSDSGKGGGAAPAAPAAATGVDDGREKEPLESAIDLLKGGTGAQRSLGTAHENLHVVKHPDFVATSFVGELEVLAEMTLSLTQQCEQYQSSLKKAP